jgi:hypothetical protein
MEKQVSVEMVDFNLIKKMFNNDAYTQKYLFGYIIRFLYSYFMKIQTNIVKKTIQPVNLMNGIKKYTGFR